MTTNYCLHKPQRMMAILGSNSTVEDLEQTDEGLNTPLIYAVRYKKPQFLKQLIDMGANVNYHGATTESLCPRRNRLPKRLCPFVNNPCTQNQTALHWALANKDLKSVKMLMAAGADPELKDGGCEGRRYLAQMHPTRQEPMSPLDHAMYKGHSFGEEFIDMLKGRP